jgi:transposase
VADRDRQDELSPGHPGCADRRSDEGPSKKEIIRCLKRYVAREVYRQLRDGA